MDTSRRVCGAITTVVRMRITVTVTLTSGAQQDLVVEAEGEHDGAALTAVVVEAVGLRPGSSLWAGSEKIGSTHRLGLPPLTHGADLLARPETLPECADGRGPSPLRLAVVAGPDAGRDLGLPHGSYTIGRGSGCDLILDDPSLSRRHLDVTVDAHGVHVRDRGATNPSRVGSEQVPPEGRWLTAGEALLVGRHRIELIAPAFRPLATMARGDGTLAVSPVPRTIPAAREVVIGFPSRPEAVRHRRIPWAMLLLPLPLAAVLALLLGPRMLLFALFSPVMILGTALSDRVGARADERRQLARWSADTRSAQDRMSIALADERRTLLREHPGPFEVRKIATLPSARLWERRDAAGSSMPLRVGLGETPAATRARRGTDSPVRARVADAPVVLDLHAHPVTGLVGTPSATARLARSLLGQVVSLYPPGEVEVLVLGEPPWIGGLRLAPHVRLVETSELESLAHRRGDHPSGTPVSIVVTDRPARWRGDRAWRLLLTDAVSRGARVLMTAEDDHDLPHECGTIISCLRSRAAVHAGGSTLVATVDGVDESWGEAVGRALAPLRDATPGSQSRCLPGTVPLSAVVPLPHSVPEQQARWLAAGSGLPATIGGAVGGPLTIDLVTDGPHALVGGTTGSGKSELLQSWIAALCLAHGPDRLNLVLVDYKGGAAFAGCAELPHTVGLLTDLDPSGARRALVSLQAEVTRRESLLAERGASDIDGFRATGGCLPRLVIVIDEFRALAQEQPEILRGLVHLAAVGRSLGLHLVLATQRPSGVVTPEIRANVNLRIALRVRDRLDSEDIIGGPDAAALPEGSPGRALLRTGSGPATPFQTAFAGAPAGATPHLAVRDRHGRLLSQAEREDPPSSTASETALEAVVRTARAAWEALGGAAPHRPWQPPLPGTVTDDVLPDAPPLQVVWGLADRPEQQRWDALAWAPTDDHLLVLGGAGSGRSTTVASLVTRASRDLGIDVSTHLLMPPGPIGDRLATMPGVDSVLDPADPSAVRRLLARLRREVESRRRALRDSGFPTFEAWWTAGTQDPALAPPPFLLVAIDGWSHLAQGGDASRFDVIAEVEALARDATGAGMGLVIAGGRDLAASRLSSLAGRRLVLDLPDRADLLAAGLRAEEAPVRGIPGRGVLLPERTLVQVALPVNPGAATAGRDRWRIIELPTTVSIGELLQDGRPAGSHEHPLLGHSGEPGTPVSLPVTDSGVWTVIGPRRSGRSTALRLVADQLAAAGRSLIQVAHGATPPGEHGVVISPTEVDALVAAVRDRSDPVIVVDDIEELAGTPVEPVLRDLVAHCSRSEALLLASTTPDAASAVRGLGPLLCRSRTGLLLQPCARTDGDPLGVRVPPTAKVPGRGYLVERGAVTEVQVALPAEATRRAA